MQHTSSSGSATFVGAACVPVGGVALRKRLNEDTETESFAYLRIYFCLVSEMLGFLTLHSTAPTADLGYL